MAKWSHLFVGREAELKTLRTAWQKAKKREPQVVPIIAESGYGKTRLAQEFYNWLSTQEGGVGGDGYWPGRLLQKADNLQPNPNLEECAKDGRAMPFLWWGLRLSDPGARNEIVSTALRPAEEYLKAHLAAYTRALVIEDKRKRQAFAGGLNITDIGLDLAGSLIPGVGTVFAILAIGKSMVEGGLEAAGLEREIDRLRGESTAPGEAAAGQRNDLVQMIVDDLRRVAHSPPGDIRPIPLVILVDDAHWARTDEALCALVGDVLAAAGKERWPLLMIATCWEREWRRKDAEGVGGLFLAPGVATQPLFLGRAPGLGQVVDAAFSGLTPGQAEMLTDRADGNPRFLDELLRHIDRSPKLFIDRDRARSLTEEGSAAIARETFEEIVLDRLQAAPAHVQSALGVASLQGFRFSHRVVLATAGHLEIADAPQGLAEGQDPYAFISMIARDSSEFRARAYRDVAKLNLANLVDLSEAEAALRGALILGPVGDVEAAEDMLEAQLMLLDSPDQEDRAAGLKALAALVRQASQRYDHRTAGRLAERWVKEATATSPHVRFEDMEAVFEALMTMRSYGDAQFVAQILETHAWNFCDADATPRNRELHARSVQCLGRVVMAVEGADAALPHFRRSMEVYNELASLFPEIDINRSQGRALMHVADAVHKADGPKAALPLYREALGVAESSRRPSTGGLSLDRNILLSRVADATMASEGAGAALPIYSRALSQWESDPDSRRDPYGRWHHAFILGQMARACQLLEQPAASLDYLRRCVAVFEALHEELKTAQSAFDCAIQQEWLASTLNASEGIEAARPLFLKAFQLSREAADSLRSVSDLRLLARLADRAGSAMLAADGAGAARPFFREYLRISEILLFQLPTARSWTDVGLAHHRLMVAGFRGWRLREGLSHLRRSMAANQRIVDILMDHGWPILRIHEAVPKRDVPDFAPIGSAQAPDADRSIP